MTTRDHRETSPLLERERAVTAIDTAIDATGGGSGTAVMFTAPAGMGKTRMLEAAVARGRAKGAGIVRAVAAESEQALAWGVALQIGERLLASRPVADREPLLDGLPAAARSLFGLASANEPGGGLGEELSRVHGVFTVLGRACEDRPLLLVVDDLHWCDDASLGLLHYLLQRLDELPLALITSRRPDGGGSPLPRLEAISAHPRVAVHGLPALSPDAVAELAREQLSVPPGEELVQACLSATRGNPFYLHELLRELAESEAADERSLIASASRAVPETVSRSVLVRVGRLGHETIALARALAILGERAVLRQAAALAGLGVADAAAAADALARAEIIGAADTLQFVHPLVRGVIEQDTPPAQRGAMHLDAARLLDAEHEPVERVAAQLLLALPTGDPWVVERLRAAATAALRSTAPESAVAYLRRALAEPPSGDARVATLADLGRAEALAARPEGVEHLAEAARLSPPGLPRAELALERGRALYALGDHRGATSAADEGIAELAGEPDAGRARALSDELQALFIGIALLVPDLHDEGLARAQRMLTRVDAEPTRGHRALLAQAAAQAAVTGAPREQASAMAEQAWSDGALLAEETSAGAAWTFVTGALTQTGAFERSIMVADAAAADARRRADPMAFATAMYIRGCPRLLAGDVTGAVADLELALDARRYGWRQFERATAGYAASALFHAGEPERADAVLAEYGPLERARDLEDVALLGARAELRLLRGDPAGALADVTAAREFAAPLHWMGTTFWPLASLAAARLGQTELAERLAEEELALGERTGINYVQVGGLRALGLVRGGEPGLALLHRAVALGEAGPLHLQTLLAMIDLGGALRRANQRVQARSLLERAADLAVARGARHAYALARTELAATGARPRRDALLSGPASLTPSERRIAEMAVTGMTNREIAQALFVTAKTVEYHLRNAFMKLGIERRRELAAALGSG